MILIENKIPPGTYHYERGTFECDDIDSVTKHYKELGFSIEKLEKIGDSLFRISCVIPWHKRKSLTTKASGRS